MNNILEYLEHSAAVFPKNTAVKEESKKIDYESLANVSRKIGSGLLKYNIFTKPVGVYMEKGIDALEIFFGTVYAGGFYSMLNTELPGQRLKQITDVLKPQVIITSESLREKAGEQFENIEIVTAEELKSSETDDAGLAEIRDKFVDTNPLYVNFTSGSTGVPKGIAVAHRSVIDFIGYFTEIFDITNEDVIANQAPFDFDVSVKDIFSAVKTGATLVIVPRSYFSAPAKLIDYLDDNKVTTLIWAVSAICLISTFHGLDYKTPKSIKKVLFSGEIMPFKHLTQWKNHLPDAMFVNLYGPTEITCNCTYHILEKDRDYSEGIPIGKHFPNEDVFLIDEENNLISEKEKTGKILVRGTALALGYYRLPEKNAEAFIQNPLNGAYPETVYVTGDIGKYNEFGELVFCGRTDNQIKYMGHRIELEEVEHAMAAIDGVERCFCVFEKEKLKGYYVGNIEKAELHRVMKETLPIFMIPGFLRKLDEMPMTKNGKIDRQKAILSAEAVK